MSKDGREMPAKDPIELEEKTLEQVAGGVAPRWDPSG